MIMLVVGLVRNYEASQPALQEFAIGKIRLKRSSLQRDGGAFL